PELLAYLAGRVLVHPAVLDVGCGTGIQLVANAAAIPSVCWVGLDPSRGMLGVARRKAAAIRWVQGDGMTLPFAAASFDFITSQFVYHHVDHPEAMIAEAWMVFRPGGRLVLTNVAPRAAPETALYAYFPEALAADLVAHPKPET